MIPKHDTECHLCKDPVGDRGSGPWLMFQSLWITPAGKGKAVAIERATGEKFVAIHAHCLPLIVQVEVSAAKARKPRADKDKGK